MVVPLAAIFDNAVSTASKLKRNLFLIIKHGISLAIAFSLSQLIGTPTLFAVADKLYKLFFILLYVTNIMKNCRWSLVGKKQEVSYSIFLYIVFLYLLLHVLFFYYLGVLESHNFQGSSHICILFYHLA